uniref:Uncharacterized protein n=1 Tax=Euplotes harpa TaxID=151035 RepID=A0A7S3JHP6_9SPIT|mmetsp:Transcript_41278/g.47586  ORF Transcript_41278/g.47586 Transcript_41278/m.47586 type:complete len:410 (+) Transcript_41278:45-1274(+)|eukprot:CAMPEP_0168328858 /NCGR_PEP_ID=MMETSP0213-20121227/6762_1 /TAXON_ID=151035 /ORGANISM="Euplotes harpa, Strain FSP1.4" /LENGTH=409 /DNA_ID=CAMNT_0008332071 /DNA_START=30 /DNA_END=1259 /DNA_ORIENTATION=-
MIFRRKIDEGKLCSQDKPAAGFEQEDGSKEGVFKVPLSGHFHNSLSKAKEECKPIGCDNSLDGQRGGRNKIGKHSSEYEFFSQFKEKKNTEAISHLDDIAADMSALKAIKDFKNSVVDHDLGPSQGAPVRSPAGDSMPSSFSTEGATKHNESEEEHSEPRKKADEFYTYQSLEMERLKEHLLSMKRTESMYKTNGKRKSKKGRKKVNVFKANDMYELIQLHVIPRWQKYLLYKSAKCSSDSQNVPRPDTIWKKILRDVREFFRILFRVRFHYLDFKDCKGALKCIDIMFRELGIPLPKGYQKNVKLFAYIHQSHRLTNRRMFENDDKNWDLSPFEVIERFNDNSRRLFMGDIFCSRLFYFVFRNYLQDYCKYVNPKYQVTIMTMIGLLLRCYSRMSERAHLERIFFLLE